MIRTLEGVGAPVGTLSAASLRGEPSDRDERISRAIDSIFATLAMSGDAASLGELAALSPRQLQRVLHDFADRYGTNYGNWRDTRNRFRLQLAAVLLTAPGATVADIAEEVGFSSAPALARAFAAAGYPAPTALRRLLPCRAVRPSATTPVPTKS